MEQEESRKLHRKKQWELLRTSGEHCGTELRVDPDMGCSWMGEGHWE